MWAPPFKNTANVRLAGEAAEAGEDEIKMILELAEVLEDRLAAGRISRETYSQLRGKHRAEVLEDMLAAARPTVSPYSKHLAEVPEDRGLQQWCLLPAQG